MNDRNGGRAAGAEERARSLEQAMGLIRLLADQVGPRRPTTASEELAAESCSRHLAAAGAEARSEEFDGYSSFGYPFGGILLAGLLPSLLPARFRRTRSLLALGAGAALVGEGSLKLPLLSRLLSRRRSRNVVATLEPSGPAERTLCLSCHLDTSRSGLIFHPRLVGLLGNWIAAQSIATIAQALGEPLLGGSARGRRLLWRIRLLLGAGLLLLAEREWRGVEVPGANDNASGCAVAATLTAEVAASPLQRTRLVLLMTGCEESGTLGSQAFLRAHDTSEWLFLNFDNVGGPGTVRFLRREGVLAKWDADPGLIAVAADVAERQPELRMAPTDSPAGLTYDTSPIHAAGGRGLTLSVQDGSIPNLHWPTDTYENIDRGGVSRTLDAGREMIAAVDRGEADEPVSR